MGVIRRLVTVVELQADKAAKALKKYDALWKSTATSIGTYASSVEADANRVIAAAQRMATAVNAVPRSGHGGGGGSVPTSSRRASNSDDVARLKNAPLAKPRSSPRGDDLDRAIAAANKAEAARAAGLASTQARMAGLAAGSTSVRAAADALGFFASKSDKAKAAVKDLEAQVARNRKEMADLKVQVLTTGDADGTLTNRMQGLAVATGQAQVKLGDARKELRAVDGGLIDAINNSSKFSFSLSAMAVAAGNFISAGLQRAVHEVAGAVVGATQKAIEFEDAFARISKVIDDKSPEHLAEIDAGIKQMATSLGVLPTELANSAAALAASGLQDDLLGYTEDAAKLGVAFDLTGQEAGHALASLTASLGLSRTEMQSLTGTINELDDGMNSSSKQLVGYLEEVAGIGRAASVSGETLLALGSAIISTGVSEDKAATGVKNFLATLEAGEAATDAQVAAFKKLGFEATELAKAMTSGRAEETIKAVAAAIGDIDPAERFSTLIDLFGRESIGNVGGLATNVDLLGKSFEIAGDAAGKAATSVDKEFARVSQTSGHQIDSLKASVEVLAIEFGKALLPSIIEVVGYLNSPEGQAWGREAVRDLVGLVKSLVNGLKEAWPVVKAIGGAMVDFADLVGGATIAVGLLAGGLLALTGPFVAVPVLAVAAGAAIATAFTSASDAAMESTLQMQSNFEDMAKSLADGRDKFGVLRDILGELTASTDKSTAAWAAWMQQMLGATDAVERFYQKDQEGKIRAGTLSEAEARKRSVDADRLAYAGRTKAAYEANAAAQKRSIAAENAAGNTTASGQARFDALSAKVAAGEKLKPSEAKEYTKLSKELDEAKASKPGRGHKPTKMDQQLAAMDPSVRALLTRGGATDAGGDLKRADNVLDRAVFSRATGGAGGGGGSSGPGPNVTTIYNTTNVQVQVDASSSAPAAENMRAAAADIGQAASSVRFVGQAKIVAARNAGGRA